MGIGVFLRTVACSLLAISQAWADPVGSPTDDVAAQVEPSCVCGSLTTTPRDPYLAQARTFGMRVNPDLKSCTILTCPVANALIFSLYYQASVRKNPEALKVLEMRYIGQSSRKPTEAILAKYADLLYGEFQTRRPDLPVPASCKVSRSAENPEMLFYGMPVLLNVEPNIKVSSDPKYAIRTENYRCMLMIKELQSAAKP